MNPIDLAIVVILIAGFIWGFTKGFVYMIFSLIAILGGVFGAGKLVPLILPLLFNAKNQQLGYIVLFVVIFTVIYFIIRKISYLLEDVVEFLELEWLDSLLGGLIGLFQFMIIIGVIVIVANDTGFIKMVPQYQDILFANYIAGLSQNIIQFFIGKFSFIGPNPGSRILTSFPKS